ncbi:50S ribosomal protein L10 [Candidatus Dependentiae bacterium]|nr:50S ribosomal protein L10 [Candidatus Dependentiae bacterium]
MNKQQKQEFVLSLRQQFQASPASFLVGYKGLSVADMTTLKKALGKQGATLKVAKMRLVKKAVDGVEGVEQLSPFCENQLGVVFVGQEPNAVAKVLYDFAKEKEKLVIVAGCIERAFVDKEEIVILATLPSREVLLAQLCATLQAPLAQFIFIIQELSGREQQAEPQGE